MRPLIESRPQPPPREKGRYRRAWRESHGNALLGFAALIFVLGLLMIWASPPSREVELEILDQPVDVAPELPDDALLVRVTTSKLTSKGPIRIAVYDSEEAFGDPDKAIIKDSLPPINGFAVWEIKLDFLPERFSIAAYHDLDDNGRLNRALFNAPIEPYGFSNNARSLVGPPRYEQTQVERPAEPSAMEIRVY